MHAREPGHWLYRLDPSEWLAAANTELAAADEKFRVHSARAGVTHCRRAAGMALNAVLLFEDRPDWGRSYMEHVAALATTASEVSSGAEALPGDLTDDVITAAQRLREAPTQAPALIQLARKSQPDHAAQTTLAAAHAVVDWARTRVARLAARQAGVN